MTRQPSPDHEWRGRWVRLRWYTCSAMGDDERIQVRAANAVEARGLAYPRLDGALRVSDVVAVRQDRRPDQDVMGTCP